MTDKPITNAHEAIIARCLREARETGTGADAAIKTLEAELIKAGFEPADAWAIAYQRVNQVEIAL